MTSGFELRRRLIEWCRQQVRLGMNDDDIIDILITTASDAIALKYGADVAAGALHEFATKVERREAAVKPSIRH